MAQEFKTKSLGQGADGIAPDGAEVRLLHDLGGGGMAHFKLAAQQTSTPIVHETVDEIWYFIAGRGEMWRKNSKRSKIVDVYPGISVTIPVGTRFQFRSTSKDDLEAIGQTMPPWPGDSEWRVVDGKWKATVGRASSN